MSSSGQSGTGLAPNVAGALSYLAWAFTGILFYVLEKDRLVRFNALQSIFMTVAWVVLWIVLSILGVLLGAIPVLGALIGFLLSLVLSLGALVLWLYMMWMTYQGKTVRLPYIADMADKYVTAA